LVFSCEKKFNNAIRGALALRFNRGYGDPKTIPLRSTNVLRTQAQHEHLENITTIPRVLLREKKYFFLKIDFLLPKASYFNLRWMKIC